MKINFTKEGTMYVATFVATSDFNLHVEKREKSFLYVYQKTTANGKYDSIKDAKFSSADLVIDCDFTALIYPKYIKIESESEPMVCEVTMA